MTSETNIIVDKGVDLNILDFEKKYTYIYIYIDLYQTNINVGGAPIPLS